MKREWWAAGMLAAGCIALALLGQNSQGGADVIYALAMPFVWAGIGLRALSLSGWAGNVLAILLYALLSLVPLWPLVSKARRPKGRTLRWLLISMSAYLFFLLYFMVNPSLIQTLFHSRMAAQQEALQVEQLILCMFFYSLLIACWVLYVMADTDRIPLQLRRLMIVLGAVMIVSVFYINVVNLKSALSSVPKSTEDSFGLGFSSPIPGAAGSPPAYDGFMAVVRFVFDSAPVLLLLTVLPVAGKLLHSLERSYFSEENQRHAAAIGGRCRLVILVSLGGMLITNVLQLFLARSLHNVNVSGQIPLITLILSLAMMLLSRYLERSFAVYRENQMMI